MLPGATPSIKGRMRSLHYQDSVVHHHACFANNEATIRVVHQTEEKCCGLVGQYSIIKEGATAVGKKRQLYAVKTPCWWCRMSLCQKYFCYFQQNHPEFQKNRLLLFISYLPHGYKPSQTIRDLDKPPVVSGLNTIRTELNG